MVNPQIDLALLVEIQSLLELLKKVEMPIEQYRLIFPVSCKLNVALVPLLNQKVEVSSAG